MTLTLDLPTFSNGGALLLFLIIFASLCLLASLRKD